MQGVCNVDRYTIVAKNFMTKYSIVLLYFGQNLHGQKKWYWVTLQDASLTAQGPD